MRVAMVHYHLRPGGVTRVIQHAASALRESNVDLAILSGEPPRLPIDGARSIVIEELGYDAALPAVPDGQAADRLEAAARSVLGAPPDVWHVHNHSLGKNRFLPQAVVELAARGRPMLLQIHDFAEDNRPGNFAGLLDPVGEIDIAALGRRLYPYAPHVHYAVLNARDHGVLVRAGVAAGLHLLPNPVRLDQPAQPRAPKTDAHEGRYFIYPTRAIRRKNLGELLLWAAVQSGDRFAVTLAPENPEQRPRYDRWIAFAEEKGLPVAFEIGRRSRLPFVELLQTADALVTTSVAEGFGLSFLEPWLIDRPLVGRNLPEVTGQLRQAGMDLSGMYERLDIPLAWIGADVLRRRVREALQEHLAAYGRAMRSEDAAAAWDGFVQEGWVDFGRLDEPLQELVIDRLCRSRKAAADIRPATLGDLGTARDKVAANRGVVAERFSVSEYGARLRGIYEALLGERPGPLACLSIDALLDAFLDPARFSLLQTH